MNPKKWIYTVAALIILSVAPYPAMADQINVDTRLALFIDVSGSIDNSEFLLQRQGYIDAFNSSEIVSAIQSGEHGAIAVSVVYWSHSYQQSVAVDWMLVDDAASAANLSTALSNSTRPFASYTSISGAIDKAVDLFAADTTFNSTRDVLDISGDGYNNRNPQGISLASARADALAAGIVINGIVIGSEDLLEYYQDNVIGGEGSFALRADGFQDFGEAISTKLVREISVAATPEPGTIALTISALGVIGYIKRRRGNKAGDSGA
jgi:hypothetical protein